MNGRNFKIDFLGAAAVDTVPGVCPGLVGAATGAGGLPGLGAIGGKGEPPATGAGIPAGAGPVAGRGVAAVPAGVGTGGNPAGFVDKPVAAAGGVTGRGGATGVVAGATVGALVAPRGLVLCLATEMGAAGAT